MLSVELDYPFVRFYYLVVEVCADYWIDSQLSGIFLETIKMTLLTMQRQKLNLASLHRECELNYGRLIRLIAGNCDLGSCFCIQSNHYPNIEFKVIEVTKFTATLALAVAGVGPKWLPSIDLKVRIYRDAKMAEVIEWCSDGTIPWDLVERKGLQSRDEKWQWNLFLGELLWQGLSHRALQAQSK